MEDYLKTKNIDIEFVGINSGDNESFCWDVDKDTFIKIKGKEPETYDKSYFNERLYRVYPSDFYGFDSPKSKVKLSIEILEK